VTSEAAPRLRDVRAEDMDTIGTLNDEAVPHVNRLSREQLEQFRCHAFYFRVVCDQGMVGGFLIGLTPDASYDSINFLWFRDRYERFVYIDRIVVAPAFRRRGLGRWLYDDLATRAGPVASHLTCEVNVRPRNDTSLRFHERLGFIGVGEQDTEGGTKRVVLLARPLGP